MKEISESTQTLQELEGYSEREMFGIKDLRDIAKSLRIVVDDLARIYQSKDNVKRGKRIISLLMNFLKNKKVQTMGPREIILQHFIVQVLVGILLLDQERTRELVDLIPIATAFKVLLSVCNSKISMDLQTKQEISQVLTELLQNEFGISSLIQVFPKRNIGLLAKLINSVPKNTVKSDYYRNISTQIFKLVSEREVNLEKANIGAEIIIEIMENSQKDDLKGLFMDCIHYPFDLLSSDLFPKRKSCFSENTREKLKDLDGNIILVTEEELERAVVQMQLILYNVKGKKKILNELVKAFRGLYYLYQHCFNSKLGIRNMLEELVTSFLEIEEIRRDCTRMICFKPVLRNRVNIVYGASGGLALSQGVEKVIELEVGVFMTFLKKIDEKPVVAQLMLDLLEFNFCLEDVESKVESKERILIFNLILAIMDEYGMAIIQNISQLFSLIKSIIISQDDDVVPLGLTLLTAVLGNDEIELSIENRADLKELTAILDEYMKKNEEICALAEDLKILMVLKAKDDNYLGRNQRKDSSNPSNTKFQEAIRSLADPLLPIRAFGLNTLRGLVLSEDSVIAERLDLVINIFLEQLADEDSFIYLNSVKGLSALTEKFPVQSLTGIVSRYKDSQRFSLDYRLRVGEALMQTIQRSGTAFAKYGTPILESILKVLHDEKKEMRVSAMSCLAMISQEAPLTLLPIIYQVMQYFTNLLAFEDSVETRRAAVFNFACLIKGMDESFFTHLSSDIISSLQRQLEYIETTDQDLLTKSHARDAISNVYNLAPFLPK